MLVTLAACGLAAALLGSGLTAGGDRLVYDALIQGAHQTPSDRILIVGIDDESLRRVGAWPWSRSTYAGLLESLTALQPAAVGYDVMFLEPKDGDEALAAALRRSGRTVLPLSALAAGDSAQAVRVLQPIVSLEKAARALGHVELTLDPDGVLRRNSQQVASGGRCWSAFASAVLAVTDRSEPNCRAIAAASSATPGLLASPPRLIPFASRPDTFRTVSASAVLAGELPIEFVRGKMVLVGVTALGLGDRHQTAASGGRGAMTGVEVQANLLDAALHDRRLSDMPPVLLCIGSIACVFASCCCLLVFSPRASLIAVATLSTAVAAGCVVLFVFSIWAPPLSVLAGQAIVYPLWSWRRLAVASRVLRREIEKLPHVSAEDGVQVHDPLGRQLDSLSRAAALLRALQHQADDTLQSLPDPTVVVDPDGVITLANRQAQAFGGAGAAQPVGMPLIAWLGLRISRSEAADVVRTLEDGAASIAIRSTNGVDYEAARADVGGSGEGGRRGAIFRLHDVSEVRRAARQREEVIQLLTHDLRAPLASILALTASQASSEPVDADRIGAYARRGLELAEGYVQFARAETKPLNFKLLDLSALATEAVDELWPQAQARGVVLQVHDDLQPTTISADRSLIMRALINIIDNAIKASPERALVSVSVENRTDSVVATVEDEGPGFPKETMDRLFEPFQQGLPRAAEGFGVGLGLSTVGMVALRHGAHASLHNRPAGGVIFVLEFPRPRHVEA